MARQSTIVKLNRLEFTAIVLGSQNAMSFCHTTINLPSLTKGEGGEITGEKQHKSKSDTSVCMILFSSAACHRYNGWTGKRAAFTQDGLGAATSDIIHWFQIAPLTRVWVRAKCGHSSKLIQPLMPQLFHDISSSLSHKTCIHVAPFTSLYPHMTRQSPLTTTNVGNGVRFGWSVVNFRCRSKPHFAPSFAVFC